MARQLRVHPPGGFHHVTARGNDRMALFADDEDRFGFLKVLSEACRRHRCTLVAYCLMTNHVHLTLLDLDGNLSAALRHTKGVYAQRFNQRHGRTGHLFEGRFWNSLLETDSYLATAVRYVHLNPVEAGVVTRPDLFPWSSYVEYLGTRPELDVLDTSHVMDLYGGDVQLFSESTHINDAAERGRRAQLSERRPAPVLGSAAFRKRMLADATRSAETNSSRRRAEQRRPTLSIDSILVGVDQVGPAGGGDQTRAEQRERNDLRAAGMLLARGEGWPLGQIAEGFGVASTSAVSMACRRLESRLEGDEAAARRLQALADHLAVNC